MAADELAVMLRAAATDVLPDFPVVFAYLYGSRTGEGSRPDSDVDLLGDLPSGIGLFGVARVAERLQQILDAPVELIPATDLKPGVRPAVLAELVPL